MLFKTMGVYEATKELNVDKRSPKRRHFSFQPIEVRKQEGILRNVQSGREKPGIGAVLEAR